MIQSYKEYQIARRGIMEKKLCIAIDGPAAAGKSTVAKIVAGKSRIFISIRVPCTGRLRI